MMIRQGFRRSFQCSTSMRRIVGERPARICLPARSFSTSEELTIAGRASKTGENATGSSSQLEKERLWMGPDLSLQQKIDSLINHPPGELNRLDIHLTAVDLITECCKRRSLAGMQLAHDILNRLLLEKHVAIDGTLMISAEPFEQLLFGWNRLADSTSPKRMREILHMMEKEYASDIERGLLDPDNNDDESASRTSCQPTTSTYNTILRGLAQVAKKDPSAAFDAEDLLIDMMKRHTQRGWRTKPNTRSWTHVIQAHGNSHLNGSADRAEKLLKEMISMHEKERERYEAKFLRPYNLKDPSANVHHIVTPDERVYSTVLAAIVNSGAKFSTERAHDLLKEWLDAGAKLDAFAFNAVIVGFARLADASKMPNPRVRFEAATKAEELARLFLQDHREVSVLENKELNPEEVDEHWTRQLTIGFNAALGAWARSDVAEAATRAEALFSEMVESPMLKPDLFSMNNTLNAWARARDPHKAEEMLDFMNSLYENGDEASLQPDAYSYCIVMSAWAKSRAPDKTLQVKRLLDIVLHKYAEEGHFKMKPNLVAFTTVLNAAGHTTPEIVGNDNPTAVEEAYRIALQTYEVLVNDSFDLGLKPDALVYASMLRVIATHTDKLSVERRHMLERVFDDACAAGQVSSHVIKEVRLAVPDRDMLARLLRSEDLAKHLPNVRSLPERWSKEVPKHPRFLDVDVKGGGKRRNANSR